MTTYNMVKGREIIEAARTKRPDVTHVVLSLIDETIDLGSFMGSQRGCLRHVVSAIGGGPLGPPWRLHEPVRDVAIWELPRGAILIVPLRLLNQMQEWLLDRAVGLAA